MTSANSLFSFSVMDFEVLKEDIRKRKFKPIYLLYGEEPYFLDQAAGLLENSVVTPEAKSFNQDILFGPDLNAQKLIRALKSFPVMSEYRLIVVKEFHRFEKREFEHLIPYFKQPVASSILVLIFKDKLDKRLKWANALISNSVALESKKLYDNQVRTWISGLATQKKLKIDPEEQKLIHDYLGNNLGLIENEFDKISLLLSDNQDKHVRRSFLMEVLNLDKEFNVFELQDAISTRNFPEAMKITEKMMLNTKENPPIAIIYNLFSHFKTLFILKSNNANTEKKITEVLNIKGFIAQKYLPAIRNFSMFEIRMGIRYLLDADLQLKGIKYTKMPDTHIVKTLVYNILKKK